jgi:hypothetical protein
MNVSVVLRIILGYATSLLIGHIVVSRLLNRLWRLAPPKEEEGEVSYRPHPTILLWGGIVERLIYTSSIALAWPTGIVAWFVLKAAIKWKMSVPTTHDVSGCSIYMVGSGISLMFGVIGGLIVKWQLAI